MKKFNIEYRKAFEKAFKKGNIAFSIKELMKMMKKNPKRQLFFFDETKEKIFSGEEAEVLTMSIKTMVLTEWILSAVKQMSTQEAREEINKKLIAFQKEIEGKP